MTARNPMKVRVAVLIGAITLGLLGAGVMIAYFYYSELARKLEELQTGYTAEQTEGARLARRGEELSKAVEQARARVKALEAAQKASEDKRAKLEAKNTRLETAVQGLQAAKAAEQATAGRLTQRAQELTSALEQEKARVRGLEVSQKASEQGKSELAAKSAKLETAMQGLQTAYAAEQATTKKLIQKAEELSKALEEVQARLKTSELKAGEKKTGEVKTGEARTGEVRTGEARTGERKAVREERPGSSLADLHHALGLGYSKAGMNKEALKAFQTALLFDPNHSESHLDLARLYLGHFDDKKSATPHLRQFLMLRPESKDYERVKGWLIRVEKELTVDKERKSYGKMEINKGLHRIFD
jgi:tetratricopeptide (TPR) repeat protein